MDILIRDIRFVKCNGGYTAQCILRTAKQRHEFGGATILVLHPDKQEWVKFSNKILDECTRPTLDAVQNMVMAASLEFRLEGAL